jgi:hypothetical protein
MTTQEKSSKNEVKTLEILINNAIKKIGGRKENDICRYLPMESGGYMHHFTLRKMKTEEPEALSSMINKFIVSHDKPSTVAPKQRAARGSRKKRDQLFFSKIDIDRLRNLAILAGDREMARKLTQRKDLRTIKRELISSIRHGKVDADLWNSYVETITSHNNYAAALASGNINSANSQES